MTWVVLRLLWMLYLMLGGIGMLASFSRFVFGAGRFFPKAGILFFEIVILAFWPLMLLSGSGRSLFGAMLIEFKGDENGKVEKFYRDLYEGLDDDDADAFLERLRRGDSGDGASGSGSQVRKGGE